MDYVVGSVAALIAGNVTPNRPKISRRALTPIKHQTSPNVTPKSEMVDDRSIFLSPTLQKKKAIVKKSPKRIFQNPDMDVTSENENSCSPSSPKADKVKKHLKEDLEGSDMTKKKLKSPKKKNVSISEDVSSVHSPEVKSPQSSNENTPKKKKNKNKSSKPENTSVKVKNPVNELKRKSEDNNSKENIAIAENSPKKKKKKSPHDEKGQENIQDVTVNQSTKSGEVKSKKNKNKNRKNKSKAKTITTESVTENVNRQENIEPEIATGEQKIKKSKTKNKEQTYVNPNAVTDKDSDSEHESDNEIVSENEEANKEILDTGPVEDSSDEEEDTKKSVQPKKAEKKEKPVEPRSEDDVKRTLFVGNVPFSKKCKKEVKKIFSKHGDIETVRIRTVPVKDARVTPKLAVIKNELHPDRTTVNVYIKYKDPLSVEKALIENNTVLNNCHLRVSRSESTGAEHDPRCSVFVGNVPFAIEDETLREKFDKCGEIVSVRVIRDKKTNAGKGFAYVNFKTKDGVELALALAEEDLTIKNRIMRVKRCTQMGGKPNKDDGRKPFQSKHQGGRFPQNQGRQSQNQGRHSQNQGRQSNQRQFGRNGSNFGQRQEGSVGEGAVRRLMHKRKNQEGNDGPPDKRQKNFNQPPKEKKSRQEFVGMTAEKKKKQTFSKGQKKKKALSEILTKYS